MLTLPALHTRLQRDARARPWRIDFALGHGQGHATRAFTFLAPPAEAKAVLHRVHNGILLLQPASVRITAPVEAERLQPWIEDLRAMHAVPIAVNRDEPPPMAGRSVDIPALEIPDAGLAPLGGHAVGLDIGGTGMKACALRDGRVIARAQAPTWPEGENGAESLVRRARDLVRQVAPEGATSLGIGFASPMGRGGQLLGLSTVMRQRVGSVEALADFPDRVSEGLVRGPVAFFNDLANLGRTLSARGRRRLLRLQVGTSFGGCWIDADGTVNAVELGRLVVDASPEARPHTYLPLAGAMKSYLSNYGVAITLSERLGVAITDWDSGFRWADLLVAGDPLAREVAAWMAGWLSGVVAEVRVFLPGLEGVEVGGTMLQGAVGRLVKAEVERQLPELVSAPPAFQLARDPGYDGAEAAALGPLLATPLRGMRRVGV